MNLLKKQFEPRPPQGVTCLDHTAVLIEMARNCGEANWSMNHANKNEFTLWKKHTLQQRLFSIFKQHVTWSWHMPSGGTAEHLQVDNGWTASHRKLHWGEPTSSSKYLQGSVLITPGSVRAVTLNRQMGHFGHKIHQKNHFLWGLSKFGRKILLHGWLLRCFRILSIWLSLVIHRFTSTRWHLVSHGRLRFHLKVQWFPRWQLDRKIR